MSDLPTPDWTLDHERFTYLFGPLLEERAGIAWVRYEEAKAERQQFGYEPDLSVDDEDDDAYVWDTDAMRDWTDEYERMLYALTREQLSGFLDRLMTAFVDDMKEALGLMEMIEERQPACSPAIQDSRRRLVADLERIHARVGS